MKKLAKVGRVFLLLSLFWNFHETIFGCTEIADTEINVGKSNLVWKDFRKVFPFHIQTIAYDKKDQVLLITEPPPDFTIEKFKETAPELKQIEVNQQNIGCDGWVKDLVIQVPQMTDSQRQDLFDRINLYLFHTTYKAQILDLPVKKSSFDNENTPLDVKVTFSDLKDWFLDKNETFESVLTGEQIQFSNIISQKISGVYVSNEPGLVIWTIDRKKPLNNYLAEARWFSLDSDLIVGAVSNADMIAVVGRKRVLPLDVLPPLRTETILQLAAIKNPDLAQSYERKYVFAGRFNEKDDWAPIYLSDELIDTEYGSLLNITDQILKRWSMKGTVNYINFESYDDPKTFPFGNKTLAEYLGVEEVTFNWNTFGVGYSSEIQGKRIFALNRTGALPTSYLGEREDNYSEAEEKGYDYFAKTGDPNLARVVQYAALYQIFQDSRVTIGNDDFSYSKYSPDNEELFRELINKIDAIKNISPEEIETLNSDPKSKEIADGITKIKAFKNIKDIETAARSILEPRNLNNQTSQKILAYYKNFQVLLKQVELLESSQKAKISRRNSIAKQYNTSCVGKTLTVNEYNKCVGLNNEVVQLEKTIVALEGKFSLYESQIFNLESTYGVFLDFNAALNKVFELSFDSSETNRLKDIYLQSLPFRNSKWIHTPSIVISNSSDIDVIGGHNLDSKITIFRTGNVPPGKVQIIEQGGKQIIITNPGDINKMSAMVRTAAVKNKNGDVNVLKASLESGISSQKNVIPKPKPIALELPTTQPNIKKDIGWFPEKRINAFEDDVITITKRADGAETIIYGKREITAYSPTSRNDYLSSINYGGKEPVRIRMVNYEGNEAEALKTSLMLKRPIVGERKSFIQSIKDFGGTKFAKDYDFTKANIGKPQFEVIGKGVEAQTKVTIDVEIPLSASAKPGLYLRIENVFKGIVSRVRQQQIIQRFRVLLGNKLNSRKDTPDTKINLIISEIQSDIKKEFPDVKVFFYEDATVSKNLRKDVENGSNAE